MRPLAFRVPWDQQWSLRIQQVLAFESDLLEYEDIFEGSKVIESKVAELVEASREEIDRVQAMGERSRSRIRLHEAATRVLTCGNVAPTSRLARTSLSVSTSSPRLKRTHCSPTSKPRS